MDSPVATKICSKCPEGQNVKPVTEFGKHKRGKNGLRATCKACDVKAAQARYTPRPRKFYPVIDGKKECSKCHAVKVVDAFSPDPNPQSKTGVRAHCKECAAQATSAWREKPGNREHELQAHQDWLGTPGNKERKAAMDKRWHSTHLENGRLSSQRRRERNKDKPEFLAYHREKTKIWERAHPENVRQRAVRRYGRKKGIPQIDVVDVDVLYARDNATCSLCYLFVPREEASQDHVIPITKAGSEESYANSALAHIDCNRRKHNNIVVEQILKFYKGDLAIMRMYVPEALLNQRAKYPQPERQAEQLQLF
jgi:5-methylcytosine-specific restriction endonuclease McrA